MDKSITNHLFLHPGERESGEVSCVFWCLKLRCVLSRPSPLPPAESRVGGAVGPWRHFSPERLSPVNALRSADQPRLRSCICKYQFTAHPPHGYVWKTVLQTLHLAEWRKTEGKKLQPDGLRRQGVGQEKPDTGPCAVRSCLRGCLQWEIHGQKPRHVTRAGEEGREGWGRVTRGTRWTSGVGVMRVAWS